MDDAARDHDRQRSGAPTGSTGPGLLAALAAGLLCLSGFLLNTLVLQEPYLVHGRQEVVLIGVPAVAGLLVAALAVRRARRR